MPKPLTTHRRLGLVHRMTKTETDVRHLREDVERLREDMGEMREEMRALGDLMRARGTPGR